MGRGSTQRRAEPGQAQSETGGGWGSPVDFGSNAEAAERLARRPSRPSPTAVGAEAVEALAQRREVTGDPTADLVRGSNPGVASAAPAALRAAMVSAQNGQLEAARDAVEANRTAMVARWGADGDGAATTVRRQLEVSRQIQQATGRVVQGAPSEEDLTAWFGTMNDPRRRSQAEQAFRDYTAAFHVHTGNVAGRPDDIRYTNRRQRVEAFQVDGQAVAGGSAAVTGPTSMGQVLSAARGTGASHGAQLGQVANDCQGYALLSERLMGAAGYRVEHVVGNGAAGAHAMTRLEDPDTRRTRVQSNGDFYDSLDEGYTRGTAVVPGRSVGRIDHRFVTGATMDEAEARNALANPAAR
jgi:hypothetical protein